MEELYQDMSITNGVLTITFNIFTNAGGWGKFTNGYKFRYQDAQFMLIGADHFYLHRGSGETEDRSYNFITKKVKISTGNISTHIKQTAWRPIKFKQL